MPESVREWLAPLLALIGGGGLVSLFQAWRKPSSAAEVASAQAEMVKALNEQFKFVIERLERVEAEAEECREKSLQQERQIADLLSERDELRARIRRLEEGRVARDIADAAKGAPGTFTTIEGDKVTTLRPPRQPRRKDGQ